MYAATAIMLGITGAYVYLRLEQPAQSTEEGGTWAHTRNTQPPLVEDVRWSSLRYYGRGNLNPNEWTRVNDVGAAQRYARDKWMADDDGYHRDMVVYNPARKNQRRLATGGAQPRPNFRARQLPILTN